MSTPAESTPRGTRTTSCGSAGSRSCSGRSKTAVGGQVHLQFAPGERVDHLRPYSSLAWLKKADHSMTAGRERFPCTKGLGPAGSEAVTDHALRGDRNEFLETGTFHDHLSNGEVPATADRL